MMTRSLCGTLWQANRWSRPNRMSQPTPSQLVKAVDKASKERSGSVGRFSLKKRPSMINASRSMSGSAPSSHKGSRSGSMDTEAPPQLSFTLVRAASSSSSSSSLRGCVCRETCPLSTPFSLPCCPCLAPCWSLPFLAACRASRIGIGPVEREAIGRVRSLLL